MVSRRRKEGNKEIFTKTTQHKTPHPSLHPSQGCAGPCLVVEDTVGALGLHLAPSAGSDRIRYDKASRARYDTVLVPVGDTKSLQKEAHLRNSLRA